jgi:Protein of unknown function (DUF1592)/Protein of unknown function (DUF1588)/Protein of unknown function (DUF1587)/Protein of unknown function (DUF1585)/Protein of unknown function (DUF1595)/Planctomycete cytochrome C
MLTRSSPIPGVLAGILFSFGAHASVVDQYCVACHNDKLRTGGLSLTKFDPVHPQQNAEVAEKVIHKLRAGMMPPPGMPRPDPDALKIFIAGLERRIDAAAAVHPNPGTPALHRLNRTEYANSVRDLLHLDIDAKALLPADDLSHGFDNMSDALTISPTLMEAYIRAAGRISREAMGDPSVAPSIATYTAPRVISQTRQIDGAPFGTRGGISIVHDFPVDANYVFHVSFYFHQMGTSLFGQMQAKGEKIEVSIDGERAALLDVDPLIKQTQELRTTPIAVRAGPRHISAAFLRTFDGPVDDLVSPVEQSLVDVNVSNIPGLTTLPHLHDLRIDGPYQIAGESDTPSRARIFICRPETSEDAIPCARKILGKLVRQAYRRPETENDLEKLLSYYQTRANRGGFESGIGGALQAILANPEFIFRFEREPANAKPGGDYRISGPELASRLSYFLWSSAPEDELLTVASQGRLKDPAVLEREVRRMLKDSRCFSLSSNFASQWLHLQNLKDVLPDPLLFPNFDRNLAESMLRETELLFDSIIREDHSILDLLNADYTFVDERLAKHYGIPNVMGSRFRRIAVTDENRRGLLGQASILTLTSTANRTSPVQRGRWVMEVLLGTPPPAPPPNVPALKEASESATVQSVRQRLEEHRANPACAGCHKLMDPIGFSLENFDAVGAWRSRDGGLVIDSAGQLFDGAKLDGPASLRNAILNRSDVFRETFTQNLLAFGLGRLLSSSDMPAVREIDREADRDGNRFSAFVLAIVKSPAFQMRRAEVEDSENTDQH